MSSKVTECFSEAVSEQEIKSEASRENDYKVAFNKSKGEVKNICVGCCTPSPIINISLK